MDRASTVMSVLQLRDVPEHVRCDAEWRTLRQVCPVALCQAKKLFRLSPSLYINTVRFFLRHKDLLNGYFQDKHF